MEGNLEGSDSTMQDAPIECMGHGKFRRMLFSIQSRRSLNQRGNVTEAPPPPSDAPPSDDPEEEPLLTMDELLGESFAEPYSEPPCFETRGSRFWGEVSVGETTKKKAYALLGVSDLTMENVAQVELRDPERDWELFCHLPVDCMSDASDAGSENQDEFWTINIKSFDFSEDESDCDFNPNSHATTHQTVYSNDSEEGDSEGEIGRAVVRGLGRYELRRSVASTVAAAAAESATATGAMAAADASWAATGVIAGASLTSSPTAISAAAAFAAPVYDDGVRLGRLPAAAAGRRQGRKPRERKSG
jgi:hypothetical protein